MAEEGAEQADVTSVTGRVVAAHAPLTSQLSQRPCVYWDVRQGLAERPHEVGKQDFWIEDEGGRVLCVVDHVRVEALAQRRRRLLATADLDLAELSARLSELKDRLRKESGPVANQLRRERAHLATIATFLHATRAHARGKVHLAGSASAQEDWIRSHSSIAAGKPGAATANLARDAWEVVIEARQRLTAVGACRVEALPPELSAGQGYRTLPTGRVLRGTARSPLIVTGVGGIAPRPATAPSASVIRAAPTVARPTRRQIVIASMIGIAIFVLIRSAHCGAD